MGHQLSHHPFWILSSFPSALQYHLGHRPSTHRRVGLYGPSSYKESREWLLRSMLLGRLYHTLSKLTCPFLQDSSSLCSRIKGNVHPWFAAHSGFSVTSCLISCFWHLGFVRPVFFTLCLLNHTLFKVGRNLQWSFPGFSVYSWENWSDLSIVSEIGHVADGKAEMRLNFSAPHRPLRFHPASCFSFQFTATLSTQPFKLELWGTPGLSLLASLLFVMTFWWIVPQKSFSNLFSHIHSHIHSPAPYLCQCSTGFQEPPCFLSFPSIIHSFARLLLKF